MGRLAARSEAGLGRAFSFRKKGQNVYKILDFSERGWKKL
jgi:hypothetical protein